MSSSFLFPDFFFLFLCRPPFYSSNIVNLVNRKTSVPIRGGS
jgi:hypothetical protein